MEATPLAAAEAAALFYGLPPPGTPCGVASCQWQETVVYRFTGLSDGANPGSGWTEKTLHAFQYPQGGGSPAGVIFDQSGNLYGATCCGGTAGGGTARTHACRRQLDIQCALRLPPEFWAAEGQDPLPACCWTQGNLYGTTAGWFDRNEPGSAFKLTPSQGGWTEDVLHQFTLRNDGADPCRNLIMDAVGNLYGTAILVAQVETDTRRFPDHIVARNF